MRSTTTCHSRPFLRSRAGALGPWLLLLLLGAAGPASAQTPADAVAGPPEQALDKLAAAAGYVAPAEALEDDGEIVGSNTEGAIPDRSLSVFDVVHVTPAFDGRPASVGDTLLVYRDGGRLRHPLSGADLGRIVHPTALAAVTATGEDVASAALVEGFAPVVAGQRVQYLRRGTAPLPAGERIVGEGIVVGFRDPAAIVEPYSVLYLDLPSGTDLQPGDEVALFRIESQEGRELPEIRLGAARVLDVGSGAATALVVRLDRSDLRVGDRYRVAAPQG